MKLEDSDNYRMENVPSLPPAGFYLDPSDSTLARWWDGTKWTEVTRPIQKEDSEPASQESSNPTSEQPRSSDDDGGGGTAVDFMEEVLGAGGALERFPELAKNYYDRNKSTVHQSAGGALIADGVIGFGRNRVGILGALKNLFVSGIMMIFVIFFVIVSNQSDATGVQNATPATATVQSVSYDVTNDSSRTTVCSPIVSFTTVDGKEITAQYPMYSSSMCGISVGSTYEITYDAKNPTRISGIDSAGEGMFRWFPLAFLILIVFIFISSLFTLVLRATQIGGGIAIIAKARAKDRAKQEAKAARKLG